MTTPTIDPRLVHVLSGEVATLAQHLAILGHQLAAASQPTPVPGPQPRPQPQPQSQPRPVSAPLPPPPPRSMPPGPPPIPWWQRDGVVSRLLATAGAGVTVIGVVMLIVLAAQSGWFGAGPRVAAGAALSGVLIAAAHRVVTRPGGRVGAIALAATGFAGLYLDIAAVTALYEWVHPIVGLVTGLAVASIGIAVATRWSSQPLAVMVLAGIALLAPVATAGITPVLLAFLVVLQIAATPVDVREDWVWLRVVRTVPVVGAVMLTVLVAQLGGTSGADRAALLIVASVSFVAAVAGWSFTLARRAVDPVSLAAVAGTAGAVLCVSTLFSRPVAGGADVAVVLVLVAVLVTRRSLARQVRLVFAATASVAVAAAIVAGTPESMYALLLLLVACAALVAGASTRSTSATAAGAFFAVLGLVAQAQVTTVEVLSHPTSALVPGWQSVPTSVAALVMAVAGVWATLRTVSDSSARTVSAALFGATGLFAITAISVVVGVETNGSTGFFVGHCVATVLWMSVAVAALVRGLADQRGGRTLLGVGLTVVSAAMVKLFLFDLSALGGLPRAAAFLVVGVMLLGIGTRYARAFADRENTVVTADAGGPTTRSH